MFRICCTFKKGDLISPDPGSHFRQPTSPEDLSCAILGQEEMIIQIQNAKTGIQMQRPAVKLETDSKICKSPTFGDTYNGIFEPRSGMEITNTHLPTIFVKICWRCWLDVLFNVVTLLVLLTQIVQLTWTTYLCRRRERTITTIKKVVKNDQRWAAWRSAREEPTPAPAPPTLAPSPTPYWSGKVVVWD